MSGADSTRPDVKPFLKWAGGKRRLLPQYESLFPQGPVGAYYEPFVGSGAVFFHLWGQGDFAGRFVLSDANPELVNVYRVVRDSLPPLLDHLRQHKANHAKDYYYEVRALDRNGHWHELTPVERAARMLYLNRTCYNGLWRVNQKGQFNVPMGRYRRPRIVNETKLTAAHHALQGVDIHRWAFTEVLERAQPGDFIYFDPPYVPRSATSSFTNYSKGGFGPAEQETLAQVFRALDERGCHVMLSNSDTDTVRRLYAGYPIAEVKAARAINAKAGRRGRITELVVRNYT